MSNVFKISSVVQFQVLAADPASGSNGQIYYNSTSGVLRIYVNGAWENAVSADILAASYAPLASPALTGTPTAPTATTGTNTTQIATTAFVQSQLSSTLSSYALLNSPALTGTPTAPTASPGTNTTQIATTAFVASAVSAASGSYANTALSNLASTAVNVNINPASDNSLSLGVSGKAWSNVWSYELESSAALMIAAASGISINPGSGQSIVLGGNLSLNSSYYIQNLVDPVNPQDAATKHYTDNLVAGLSWKQAVEAASTGSNINLSAPGASLDGYTFNSGDRFLAKDQSNATQNGIYVWNGASAAATRSYDASTGPEIEGLVVLVINGTVNQGAKFVNTNTGAITIGTTAITFAAFSIAGTVYGTGTPNYVAYWNGTTTLTAEQYLNQSRGGFGTNVSAFNGVVKASSGMFSASSIVDSDISATAAIQLSKLASLGTTSYVLINNTSGVISTSSVTATTLSYLDATSSIQTQLNGKANTALSNLASTAVNVSILPASDNSISLGSASLNYQEVYAYALQSPTSLNLTAKSGGGGSVVLSADTGGSIDMYAVNVRRAAPGSSNFMVESYIDSIALAANVSTATNVPSLSFASSNYKGAIIDYTVQEAVTLNQRTGRILVSTDGTIVSAVDAFEDTNQLGNSSGLAFSAAISSGTVSVQYSNTSASNGCTMRAKVTYFRA